MFNIRFIVAILVVFIFVINVNGQVNDLKLTRLFLKVHKYIYWPQNLVIRSYHCIRNTISILKLGCFDENKQLIGFNCTGLCLLVLVIIKSEKKVKVDNEIEQLQ